ncbi:MAG: hypothetical protein M3247_03965 [Thermoproteota archaeon]|nr:hypothetical protein [Thermoproteota archaeon]
MTSLDDLIKEYLDLSKLPGQKVDVGRFNKVKELLGEMGADLEVSRRYGQSGFKKLIVPRRGDKGAYIIDILYELEGGQLIWVESKFGSSQLGRTIDRHTFLVGSGGKLTPLPLQRQTEQLDAQWIKDRINEIKKKDPALAKRLEDAVNKEQLAVLEVRTTMAENAVGGHLESNITDRSEQFRQQNKTGRRTTDQSRQTERRYARRESLADINLQKSKMKAQEARKAAEDAKKASDKANREVKKAEEELRKAQREKTKVKRQNILNDKKKIAEELQRDARNAEAATKKAEDAWKLNEYLKRQETMSRQTAERMSREAGAAAALEDRSLIVKSAQADTTLARMTEARGLTSPAVGESVVEGARKTVLRDAIYRFAQPGVRVVLKTIRFAFLVFEFVNPILDLLALVDLIDGLVNWLRRKEISDREEWSRIIQYLFGQDRRIVSPYGIAYHTSIRDITKSAIELQLANESYLQNFLFWLAKWNSDQKWKGFVYAQIDVELERQEEKVDRPDNIKYYFIEWPKVSLVDKPIPNIRYEKLLNLVGEADEHNRSTGGPANPPNSPEFYLPVEISQATVRFTNPQPILTPFDFLIVKCQHLVSEIITFLAKYDAGIYEGMDIRTEIIEGVKQYWLEETRFKRPLNNLQIHFCLKSLLAVADLLDDHRIRESDFDKKDKYDRFTIGFYRRLEILRKLTSGQRLYNGKRLLEEIAIQLQAIATPTVDTPDMTEYLEYLSGLATSLDDDLKRTFENCRKSPTSLEYNYLGVAQK